MRSLAWLASILLHLAVVVAAFLLGTPTGVRVDLNAPVYQVELFSLSTEPPAPGMPGTPKAEPPGATPPPQAEAKPIAAPQPDKSTPPPAPKPEPKPDLKAIAAKEAEEKKRLEDEKRKAEEEARLKAEAEKKKAEEARRKAEEEKKRKAEEEKRQREQILKDALKAASDEAKKKEKQDASSVRKELDALRKQVGSGPAPGVAAQTGSGSGGGGGPAGSTGTGMGSIAAYGRVVEQLIKANWRFPSATAKNPLVTQVEIRIAVDGSISSYRMLGTSGRADYDASAVRAIQDTKQLPPPPSPDLSVLIINFNNQE